MSEQIDWMLHRMLRTSDEILLVLVRRLFEGQLVRLLDEERREEARNHKRHKQQKPAKEIVELSATVYRSRGRDSYDRYACLGPGTCTMTN